MTDPTLQEQARRRVCYASTNSEWPNRELLECADHIDALEAVADKLMKRTARAEAENERLRGILMEADDLLSDYSPSTALNQKRHLRLIDEVAALAAGEKRDG